MKRYIKASNSSIDLDKFDEYQRKQIELGLKSNIDVDIYATPEFDAYQMYEIRKGLESGIDVSKYAYPEFDDIKMHRIRKQLESR